jgi:hypothetical protein
MANNDQMFAMGNFCINMSGFIHTLGNSAK